MSDTGKIGSIDANRMMSRMPVQNTGAEYPTMDSSVMPCDSGPLGLRAASVPSSVPARKAPSTEVTTSSSVAGTRSQISCVTGRLKK